MFNSNIRNVLCFKVFVWGSWELNTHFILYMNVHSQISIIILFFLIMFSLTYHVCLENHMFKMAHQWITYRSWFSSTFWGQVSSLGHQSSDLVKNLLFLLSHLDGTNFVYASPFFFLLWGRLSLCSTDGPRICDLPAFISQLLGLQLCAIMPGHNYHYNSEAT